MICQTLEIKPQCLIKLKPIQKFNSGVVKTNYLYYLSNIVYENLY